MKRYLALTIMTLLISLTAASQSRIVKEFETVCDSLNVLMEERTGVQGNLRIKAIMMRDGSTLDFYFTESLGDFPFRTGDAVWFRDKLKSLFPDRYKGYDLGEVHTRNVDLQIIEVSQLGNSGKPMKSLNRCQVPPKTDLIVRKTDTDKPSKGLSGRTIALWHSHGIHYSLGAERWQWQRPFMFQTGEDMFTQSFVLQYVVPMLENAGAYVMLPRERDTQRNEIIADNDPADGGRGSAKYTEKGKWKNAGAGFADTKKTYTGYENPFEMGSARTAACTPYGNSSTASVEWRPVIPEKGEYAVYISYKSLPESTSSAIYKVKHSRGTSEFAVNQKIGGSTWVYLGTFEFEEGDSGYVTLEAMSPQGKYVKGSVVTADAIRFGGGMGNIARSTGDPETEPVVSGFPRYAEGARYWLQWAGTDKRIFSPNELKDDYKDDYMSRGDWVDWISGGSYMNPDKEGKGIPVDLSFGFHTDAGVTPNDSIIGTLAIYTYRSENETELPGGESRMSSREFADIIQSQIVSDIRTHHNSEWSRRQLWDRGYRESRTPSCPAMLLELLSHQNFADMKYGLDPAFRFTVGRSVYKGMLKYLSNRYGVSYVVQPLPVKSIGVRFMESDKAEISWENREDICEPTAKASEYILYTKVDDGAFDMGRPIRNWVTEGDRLSYTVDIEPGHIYSFRIEAKNSGGRSFPSETVCIGIPEGNSAETVVIVNNFDRVSGPAYIDTPLYAGFDNDIDSGVPYIKDISYVGRMNEMRRNREWISNDNPGFGASDKDHIGSIIAGNTFDYAYVHGRAIFECGHPFISCSRDAFCSDSTFMNSASAADIICGKQITTISGDSVKYQVFPEDFRNAIRRYTEMGGNILISGANIGTDAWDQIYPFEIDEEGQKATQDFIRNTLGYRWITNHGSNSAMVKYVENDMFETPGPGKKERFYNEPNEDCYCVETPDGISPTKNGKVFLRYSDTDIAAGICHEGNGYKTVCIGFPIETCTDKDGIVRIISSTLEFFKR